MTRKMVWLLLGCLTVLALVLASCAPAEEEEEKAAPPPAAKEKEVKEEVVEEVVAEEKEMVVDALGRLVEKPQYGGTVPIQISYTGGFDPAETNVFVSPANLAYDGLVAQDWIKGPSGTGEISMATGYTPPEYLAGWLAESWEIPDLQTIIYHLRKGVRFHNKPPVNGREMTADDVVYTVNRLKEHPKSAWYGSEATITKIDAYTVRFDLAEPTIEILLFTGRSILIVPHEVIEEYGDLTDWKNVVGTGAYMVEDVVPESSTTMVRNPDYWAYDPLHPENRLPYPDRLKALVIPDPSTVLTALRTGKLARLAFERVALGQEHALSLKATSPELKYKKMPPSRSFVISLRTDLEDSPYANKKVRQALMLAIDNEAIARDYYRGDAEILTWPYMSTAGPAYTSLEELPTELRELFEYHPEKAKQLLAEAGYPDGFKTKLTTRAREVEWLTIVKHYWDAIGVETELDVVDRGAWLSQILGHTYTDMIASRWGNVTPYYGLFAHLSGYKYNYSLVSDERIDTAIQQVSETLDPAERTSIYKEIGPYIIEQQYWLQMPYPNMYLFWQPWLKGYNGEMIHGPGLGFYGLYKFAWIDQELREAMGH